MCACVCMHVHVHVCVCMRVCVCVCVCVWGGRSGDLRGFRVDPEYFNTLAFPLLPQPLPLLPPS